MSRWIVAHIVVLLLVVSANPASAADTWTDPAPGVRQLVRTVAGPIRFVAVTVDISRPEYFIRVTRPEERAKTTSTWASQVGAVVAINGDWSDGSQPVGLSVGDGVHWPNTADAGWSFMACTLEKRCTFDDHPTDTARYHTWREVVGGNGWRLLIDGNVPAYPNEAFYLSDRHPRSGVGLSADGNTMIMAVAEGRRSSSIGVTFPEMAQLFKDLGAHNAMMLDGGGSSTLVVNGGRLNQLPSNQSSERVVANHLAIIRGTRNGLCDGLPNGRFCDGNVIHTCQGGDYRGNGDCAAFGATCDVTADGVGVCVHPFCTGGPDGKFCEDETRITSCEYGQPVGTGDCGAFGASCETTPTNAQCVHYACTEGGDATWCRDDQTVATCVAGQPVDDVACADGTTCTNGTCLAPGEEPMPGTNNNGMGGGTGGDGGEPTTTNNTPQTPDGSTPEGEDEPSMVTNADGKAGCATVNAADPGASLLLLCGLLFGRRRRL